MPDTVSFPYSFRDDAVSGSRASDLRNLMFTGVTPTLKVAVLDVTQVTSSYTTAKATVVHGPETLPAAYAWRHQERFISTVTGDIVWPAVGSGGSDLKIARLRAW